MERDKYTEDAQNLIFATMEGTDDHSLGRMRVKSLDAIAARLRADGERIEEDRQLIRLMRDRITTLEADLGALRSDPKAGVVAGDGFFYPRKGFPDYEGENL